MGISMKLSAACPLLLCVLLAACTESAEQAAVPGGALRVGAVLGETEVAGFALAEVPRRFAFPRDHGPHPAFRSEWWYLTATLEDDAGREFGVQFTVFRQALAPPAGGAGGNRWATAQVYLGHLAVTDVAAGRHREAERFARGHPALAGARADPFAVWLEDWRLADDGEGWRLQARSAGDADAFAIDLRLDDEAPIYFQGEQGLSRKGPGQASYYYSMPTMKASGTLQLDGRSVAVRGTGWLDREWSTSVLSAGQVGWDWFALKLDDGRSLMAFQLRREDGRRDPFDQGLLVSAGGDSQALGAGDFNLEAERFWTDERGVRWPVVWRLSLAAAPVAGTHLAAHGPEVFRIRSLVDDQRMDLSVRYWEGIVAVEAPSGKRLGRGYLEMTGYDRSSESGERSGER